MLLTAKTTQIHPTSQWFFYYEIVDSTELTLTDEEAREMQSKGK